MLLKTSIFLGLFLSVTLVECRSLYAFGARVDGDRVILKKTIHSPTTSDVPANHTTKFQYSIDGTATYIELFSEHNVEANFTIAFDKFVEGEITAFDTLKFEITLLIYGLDFKDTPSGFRSVLNNNTELFGILVDENEFDYDIEFESEIYDDDVTFGVRQLGDKEVFRYFEAAIKSDEPTYHSVTLRYVDNQFLTCVKCKAYDVSNVKATFSHVSEHSVKAVIYHPHTDSLDVECFIYGYDPEDRPEDYQPLPGAEIETEPDALELISGSSSKLNSSFHLLTIFVVLQKLLISIFEF